MTRPEWLLLDVIAELEVLLSQVPVFEPAVQGMTGSLRWSEALFPAANQPGVAKRVGVREARAVSGHEVVLLLVVVVSAQTAQLVLVGR